MAKKNPKNQVEMMAESANQQVEIPKENQNQTHNSKKEGLGPNTKRKR